MIKRAIISTPKCDGHKRNDTSSIRPDLTRQLNGASTMADTYAIIEESGGQRKVAQDETILIDLYNGGESKAGDTITIDKVLVVGSTGGDAKLGAPYVDGASVTLEITEPMMKGDKLFIHKFRTKSTYQRKTGHRQRYTAAKVTSIKG
jgi:large subunit ribosomal protein L21